LYTSGPALLPVTDVSMPQFPEAQFITSAWQPHQFPPDEGSEVAFAGRSNSGKSSALNAITGRKDLARTSKTPGRTQLINFFALGATQRLVDLPGYGFAKVPERMKEHWQQLMSRYIEARASLAGLVLVMDARRGLTDFDVQMLDWSRAHDLPAHVLLTKADKLNRSEAGNVLKQVRAAIEGSATVQLFSAVAKTGIEDARRAVLALLDKTSLDKKSE
jgi:GTP-binding protein